MHQRVIAEKLGYSQSMISRILSGGKRMSPEKAKIAGRLCKCDPFLFLDGDPEMIRKTFQRYMKNAGKGTDKKRAGN